jgi:signal transduction histidine kinase
MTEGGLKRRLGRTFLIQAGAISIATLLGIYLAVVILEEILITQALTQEADYFWRKFSVNSDFPLPDTHNLTGFVSVHGNMSALPAPLQHLDIGFHSLSSEPGFSTVYVSAQRDTKLFLVFDGEQVGELATWFGIVPLTLVLLVLYLSVWMVYRISHRAVSPIANLAEKVNRLDLNAADPTEFEITGSETIADDEVHILSTALSGFAGRLGSFVERERNFTRDASHELRTPLTVVRIATDMLRERENLSEAALRDIDRIKRAVDDMKELVEVFLLLARESENQLNMELVSVNDIVEDEVDRLMHLYRDKSITSNQVFECRLLLKTSARVLAVLIGNLLKNAFAYTESGNIRIEIRDHSVIIEDDGIGITETEIGRLFEPYYRGENNVQGHGLGLSIVKRLSERFSWPVLFERRESQGTRVTVSFADALTSVPRSYASDSR